MILFQVKFKFFYFLKIYFLEFCDDFSHAMRLVRLVFEKHILAVENFNAEMQNEFAGVVLQTPRNFLPIGKVSIETRHQRPL